MSKDVRPHSSVAEVDAARPSARFHDMQSAARFPLQLPVEFHSPQGEHAGQTRNISANGVLFQTDAEVPIGSAVEFSICMPAQVLGTASGVVVKCRGRAVRCFQENQSYWVGVVIDEYGLERVTASRKQ
ncbi:MAG TPA: PilZ domain-containing protein [Terriglobales bacterium]|nr:PilZ domain-containing protein [Terriglobales bacterium]